jgi:hypothetical protein
VLVRNMNLPADTFYDDDGESRPRGVVDRRSVTIKAGERVGQLVFYNSVPIWTQEVTEISTNSDRGEDGFGSTGR